MSSDELSEDDYSDSEINEEVPKFWSAKEGRVCPGVELENKAASSVSLCGTYLAVFQAGECEEEFTQHSSWRGTFTLESRKSLDKKKPHPDGFKGELRSGDIQAKFLELTANEREGKEIRNSWSLAHVTSTGEEDFEACDMEVGRVKDDNGNPFVTFIYSGGRQCAFWFAKKQPDPGVDEFLTHGERERLNMGVSSRDLRKQVCKPRSKRQAEDDGEDERPIKRVSGRKR